MSFKGPDARPVLLLVSGSLRRRSSNVVVLERAGEVATDLFAPFLYSGLAELPAFNPDIEELGEEHPDFPAGVRVLRRLVGSAAAILVSTPEYAHGMPGAFKNCLDWLVGSLEFPGIPFGLVNVSPHSRFAASQCLETARTMSAQVVDEACVVIDKQDTPLGMTPEDLHPAAARALRSAVTALHAATLRSTRSAEG